MQEELGNSFTAEARNAWTTVMNQIHSVLVQQEQITNLTTQDKQIMKDNWLMINEKKTAVNNLLLK